jgi:hypothetical protein
LPWERGNYDDKPRSVAILDTHSGEIVYQTEPIGLGGAGDATWIDEDTLILFSGETWRIDLADHEAVVHRTDEYIGHYPYDAICLGDSRDFMVPDRRGLVLFDLATFEALPLLGPDIPSEYSIQAECYGLNGSLKLHVSSDQGSMIYEVKLPH